MWKLLRIIFVIKFHFIYGKLVGDHICLTEESHLVNVTENFVKNITVRHYQWCYNVPPRCSYYTVRKINDTRIVEKNQTRTIETCCAGFTVKEDKCIRNCSKCHHGECENESCLCTPGFKGDSCDVACDAGEWGSNCSRKCNCDNNICESKTGICSVRGNRLEGTVQLGPTTGRPSRIISSIPINKNEIESTHINKTPNFEDNNSNKTITQDIGSANVSLEVIETSTKHYGVVNAIPTPGRSLRNEKNNDDANFSTGDSVDRHSYNRESHSVNRVMTMDGKKLNNPHNSDVSTNLDGILEGTGQHDSESVLESLSKPTESSTKPTYTNRSQYNSPNEGFLIPVEIKYEQLQDYQSGVVHTTSYGRSEDYMSVPREGFTKKHIPSDGEASTNSAIVVGISVSVVIVLVVAMIIVTYTRKSRRKERLRKEMGTAAVSFIATSIFHKPLPNPPTTENPMYLTPVGYQRGITEAPVFETRIFYNMNAQNPSISDCREYLYDHPPSTGSYRAASSIEPLDVNRTSIYEEAEPVYDEIRCKDEQRYDGEYQNPKPSSIYINTFGKTKF